NLPQLRYEMIVKRVQGGYDKNLIFLDYLEQKVKYNLVHLFLAYCIKSNQKQMNVITTNFDYLIERALINILSEEEKQWITPIITKSDYAKYQNRLDLQDKYPVFKIHGSKRNIITNEDILDSLVTTISSLGKNREAGETFAIETFKKPLINAILSNTSLFIMGYSGNDDFDITPLLNEFSELNSIIWIEHSNGAELDDIVIFEIDENFMKTLDSNEEDNLRLSFLTDLKKKHGYDIFYIKAHTLTFVKKVLWNLFHSDIKIPLLSVDGFINQNKLGFEEFIEPHYKNFDISLKYTTAVKIYYDLSLYDDVVRVAEKGLTIVEEETEKRSNLLNHLGLIALSRGELDKALDYFMRALKIDELINYEGGIANKLNSIGMIYRRRNQFEQALSYYKRALKIFENLGNKKGLMFTYNNIGAIQTELKQPELALEYLEKSLKLSEEIGDLTRKATRLSNIAYLYSEHFNDIEKANNFIKEALKIQIEIGNYASQAISYNNLANNYEKQGNREESLKYYLKGLDIALELNDVVRLSQIYPNIAEIYSSDAKYDEAIKYIKKGIECDKQIGNRINLSNKIFRLGTYYHDAKDFTSAKAAYANSIEIAKESKNAEDMNEAAYHLAGILFDEEDYEGAIKYYSLGLDCAKELQIERDILIYYKNLGYAYERLKQFENAIYYYTQALEICQEENNDEEIIELKENVAWCYQILEDFENAIKIFEETLKFIEQSSLSNDISLMNRTLESIITTCILGDFIEKGENYAYKRLKIGEDVENNEILAYTYGNLAILSSKKGEYQKAINFSTKAIKFAQKVNNGDLIQTHEENIQMFKKQIEN
ncbi:MAG: tetratricopeptide repeat protein, partial [Candidatus Hermodarchaeota archaeon]